MPRAFIGTAVNDLSRERLIAPLAEVRAARQGGRHGNYYRVWRLAPGVDGSRVAGWKLAHPIPPPPTPDEAEGAAS